MTLTIQSPARVKQSHEALALANRIRLDRAQVKRDVQGGVLQVPSVLLDPMPCVQSMTVYDLIRAQHQWGRKRTLSLLARVNIGAHRQVRFVTARQAAAIARELSQC